VSDNLDKLKGHEGGVKQDINRRGDGEDINGKHSSKLNKRINDIAKVISDPDVWNVNIASRDRLDEIEQKLDDLCSRVNGIGYIVRKIAFDKRIGDEDIQALEDRMVDDNNISGSSE